MQIPCPSKHDLDAFLLGALNEEDAREICKHLDTCVECESMTETLEKQRDNLLQDLHDHRRSERYLEEPEFEQLHRAVLEHSSILRGIPARMRQQGAPVANASRWNEFAHINDQGEVPPHVTDAVAPGKQLRDYRLIKRIGQGGMGTVYLAMHLNLGKAFAVKILPEKKLRSRTSIARFQREMRAAGKVNHPNLINASDAGSVDGLYYLVMELVEGADLGRIVRARGPLEIADACEIVRQAALGLQHAHDSGLVHRDVKPSNIMLTVDGNVKLLDLGLADWAESAVSSEPSEFPCDGLTHAGHFVGTPGYMAPEQFRDDTKVDERSDIYGLGATLFQLLTGQTPSTEFINNKAAGADVAVDSSTQEFAPVRDDIPDRLTAYIERMLSTSPQHRPRSAQEVAAELADIAEQSDLLRLAESCKSNPGMSSAELSDLATASLAAKDSPGREHNTSVPNHVRSYAIYFALAIAVAVVIGLVSPQWIRTEVRAIQGETPADAEVYETVESDKELEEKVLHALRAGNTKQASSLAEQLVKQSPDHGWHHALAAMIDAYAVQSGGDSFMDSYEHHRVWLAKRWSSTGEGPNTIPRICCLYPNPKADLAGMLSAVTAEQKDRPKDWRYPHSQMMLLYRLGRYNDSLAAFADARHVSPSNLVHVAIDTAWSALILERLERLSEARNAYEKAKQLQLRIKSNTQSPLPKMWFDYIELVVVLAQFGDQSSVPGKQKAATEASTSGSERSAAKDSATTSPTVVQMRQPAETLHRTAADSEAQAAWVKRVTDRLVNQQYVEAEAIFADGVDRHAIDWMLRCRVTLGLMIAARDDPKHRPQADNYLQELEATLRNNPGLTLPLRAEILKLLALDEQRQWDDDWIEQVTRQIQGERWNHWELHHALATIRLRQGRIPLALDHQAAAGQQVQIDIQKWLHDYWWTLLLAQNGQLDLARRSLMSAELNRRRFEPLLESESTATVEQLDTVLEMRWMMPVLELRLTPLENLKSWVAGQHAAHVNLDHEIHEITKRLIKTPADAELYFQRAVAFTRMHRQHEAFEDFRHASMLRPDDPVYQALQQYADSLTDDRHAIRNYAQAIVDDGSALLRRLDLKNPDTAFIFRILLVADVQDHVFTVYMGALESLADKHPENWYCQYVLALWKLKTGRIDEAVEDFPALLETTSDDSLERYCTLWWVDWLDNVRGTVSEEQRNDRMKRLSELQRKTQYDVRHVVKHWLANYESMLLSIGSQEPVRHIVEAHLLRTVAGKNVAIAFDITRSGLPDSWFNINASSINIAGTHCVFAPLRSDNLTLLEIAGGKLVAFPAGGEVRCLEFTTDGKSLIVGRPNKNIDVIDIASRRATPLDVDFQPNAISHDGRGNRLAVAFQAKRAEIWDLATGKITQPSTLLLGVPRRMVFNPGGSHVAVGMNGDHATVFSDTLAPVMDLPHAGPFTWITDNELCYWRSDSEHLSVVDLENADRPNEIGKTPATITAMTYLRPQRLVVTADVLGEVIAWSLDGEQRMIGRLPRATIGHLSNSDDGRYLLVTGRRHRQGDGGSCCILFDLRSI